MLQYKRVFKWGKARYLEAYWTLKENKVKMQMGKLEHCCSITRMARINLWKFVKYGLKVVSNKFKLISTYDRGKCQTLPVMAAVFLLSLSPSVQPSERACKVRGRQRREVEAGGFWQERGGRASGVRGDASKTKPMPAIFGPLGKNKKK